MRRLIQILHERIVRASLSLSACSFWHRDFEKDIVGLAIDRNDGLAERVFRMKLQVDWLFDMILSKECLDCLITAQHCDCLVDVYDDAWMLDADCLGFGYPVPRGRLG